MKCLISIIVVSVMSSAVLAQNFPLCAAEKSRISSIINEEITCAQAGEKIAKIQLLIETNKIEEICMAEVEGESAVTKQRMERSVQMFQDFLFRRKTSLERYQQVCH